MTINDFDSSRERAAAIGTFDGMHSGHINVVDTLKELATERALLPTIITFNRHPLDVIAPQRAPRMLALPSERADAIRGQNCECFVIDFDEKLAAISAEEWMKTIRDKANVQLLVVGYDNTFGCDGINKSIHDFIAIGKKLGIEVVEAPVLNGVSSTIIRKEIAQGNIDKANSMLGHPYTLEGPVVHGQAIGKSLGFPTANIASDPRKLIPATGVYAAFAILPDGSRHPACVNIGNRPTVSDLNKTSIEAHLSDFNLSLYGLIIKLEFHKRLRNEKKFDSLSQLADAISDDAAMTDAFFNDNPSLL